MSDEPATAYRRVQTMEGWEPLDDLSAEMTPILPSAELSRRSVWVIYNHARREYVSGAPWPPAASVDDNSEALNRAMALVRTIWDHSGEGTTAISDHVESHGGDANHWSGVMNWIHGVEPEKDELVERVAKWAYERTRPNLRTEPMWEQLHPLTRARWLEQTRAAIEGNK